MARHTKHPVLSITTHSSVGNWVSSSATPMKYSLSPFPIYCTGRCREEPQTGYDLEPKADVVRDRDPGPTTLVDLFRYLYRLRRTISLHGKTPMDLQ